MSERDHIDELMKSILESGQEEVPESIWEGVSAGLDKAARHKAVVVWFRRAGAVAAAAAIAVGVLLNIDREDMLVPETGNDSMIAVVEPETQPMQTIEVETLIADAGKILPVRKENPEIIQKEQTEDITASEEKGLSSECLTDSLTDCLTDSSSEKSSEKPSVDSPVNSSEWEEDERELKEKERIRTSVVLSGTAGTNSPQNRGGISPMRSPVLDRQYTTTTVEQTSTETAYGIPLSFGAGVRLRFNERWSLGMGLNYTLLTSKFNGKYIKVENDMADAPVSANVRNSQHYIGIPINAYYNIVSRDFINFYTYAGGTVEKCVMDKYQVQTSPAINHMEDVKAVQLSLNAGIGVEFMLGNYVGLYMDPSLRYYFDCKQPKSIRTAQPLMLGFEMGLRFNL